MPLRLDTEVFDMLRYVGLFKGYRNFYIQDGLFPTRNERATWSNVSQSRSESAIAINPRNPDNMVGSSKKFIDPAIYLFRIGVIYTFDGGVTWKESQLPMQQGWDGMTDPAMAFDDFGNAFLVGEPLRFNRDKIGTSDDVTGLGMVVFKSKDGGATWGNSIRLSTDTTDDKQWIVCDNNRSSPFYGNVYVSWGANTPPRFARSTDHGNTWKGKGNEPSGSILTPYNSFAPELSVSADGTLHILWHNDGTSEIHYLRSADGGNTFGPDITVVSGVKSLRYNLPDTDGWPHFDYGKFRVITLVTDCTASTTALVVAWADMREGRSRIYYRRSLDNGVTWAGPPSGQPLLPQVTYGDLHCFHPQIIATQSGVIGCAFYVFGKEFQRYVIRVQLAASWDYGATFSSFITVTDQSWDPLVNAPAVHGDPNVHFIGEYFGLDAGVGHFALLWTDTRTGVQELFSDVVRTQRIVWQKPPEYVDTPPIKYDPGEKMPPASDLIKVLSAVSALEENSPKRTARFSKLRWDIMKSAARLLQAEIKHARADKRNVASKAQPKKGARTRKSVARTTRSHGKSMT